MDVNVDDLEDANPLPGALLQQAPQGASAAQAAAHGTAQAPLPPPLPQQLQQQQEIQQLLLRQAQQHYQLLQLQQQQQQQQQQQGPAPQPWLSHPAVTPAASPSDSPVRMRRISDGFADLAGGPSTGVPG